MRTHLDLHQQRLPGRKRSNWRGGYNYIRCLNISSPEGVLVAEDDVVYTNDFWIKFQKVGVSVLVGVFKRVECVLLVCVCVCVCSRERENCV